MKDRKRALRRPSSLEEHEKALTKHQLGTASGLCAGPALRTIIHIRDPTESELQQTDSSADPRSVVLKLPADQAGVPGPARRKAVEELADHLMHNLLVYGEAKILTDRRDPTTVVIHDLHKERDMEKNGNTFAPGDTVVAGIKTGDKTAALRRSGTIQESANDDQVKVAWDDGTTSLERPEHLQRG